MTTAFRIVLVAVIVALVLAHGLHLLQPYFQDERPLFGSHLSFVDEGTIVPTLAKYPSFYFYLSFPGTLIGVLGLGIFAENSLADAVIEALLSDPVSLTYGGRVITLMAFYLAVWLAWLGLRPFVGRFGAMVAPVYLAAVPATLSYSAYLLPDIPLLLFSLVAMVLAMIAVTVPPERAVRFVYLAAAVTGFAASTKYNGAAAVPVVFAAGCMVHFAGGRRDWAGFAKTAAVAVLVCATAFLLGSPGWLIAPQFFYEELLFEWRHAGEGHAGAMGVPMVGQVELLFRNVPLLLIGAVLGAGVWWRAGRKAAGWIALVNLAAGLAMAGITSLQRFHYLFILFPGMLYFTACLISATEPVWPRLVRLGLAAVLILSVGASLWVSLPLLRPNSLDQTRAWLDENVTPDQSIALGWAYVPEFYGKAELDELAQELRYGPVVERLRAAQPTQHVTRYVRDVPYVTQSDADFLVTSDLIFQRYFTSGVFTARRPADGTRAAREHDEVKAFYEALFASDRWRQVHQIDTGNGPKVLIFQRIGP